MEKCTHAVERTMLSLKLDRLMLFVLRLRRRRLGLLLGVGACLCNSCPQTNIRMPGFWNQLMLEMFVHP